MDKVCRDCGETKPLVEYFKSPRNAGGYAPQCKPCYMARQAKYRMKPPRIETPPGTKRCWRCKAIKPNADFSALKNFHDGLNRTCRECNSKVVAAHRKKNRENLNAKALSRYHANKERYADYSLKRHYGMSRGDYDALLAAQDGKCDICGSTSPGGARLKRFHVDHCHETGRIRGLLCGPCNTGIGQLQHSKETLLSAVKYLERHSK